MRKILAIFLIYAQLVSCSANVKTPPDRSSGDQTQMDFEIDEEGNAVSPAREPQANTSAKEDEPSQVNQSPESSSSDQGDTADKSVSQNPDGQNPIVGLFVGIGQTVSTLTTLTKIGMGEITGENRRKKRESKKKAAEIMGLLDAIQKLQTAIEEQIVGLKQSLAESSSSEFFNEKETQEMVNQRALEHNKELTLAIDALPEMAYQNEKPEQIDSDLYSTTEKQKISRVKDFINSSATELQNKFSGESLAQRQDVLAFADNILTSAQERYRLGEFRDGDQLLTDTVKAVDYAMSSEEDKVNIIGAFQAISGASPKEPLKMVEAGRRYVDYVNQQVEAKRGQTDYDVRQRLVGFARSSLGTAKKSIQEGSTEEGSAYYDIAIAAADLALSLTPVIGLGKDIYEATTGQSILNGQTLTRFERSMAVVSIATLGVAKLGVFGNLCKLSKVLGEVAIGSEEAAKAAKAAELGESAAVAAERTEAAAIKAAEDAEEILDSAKKFGYRSAEEVKDFATQLKPSPDSNFTNILYPRGPGASMGPVPNGYTKVSRWIGDGEVKLWHQGGGTRIPPEVSSEGRLFVTEFGAPNPGSGTGVNRVDFLVPKNMLNQAGGTGWYAIFQPGQTTPIHNVEIFLK